MQAGIKLKYVAFESMTADFLAKLASKNVFKIVKMNQVLSIN